MDVDEYLLGASEYVEEHYIKVLEEIERDFGIRLKETMNKGKKFRPMLTLLCCEACGGKRQEALDFAITVELVHQSSLFHDDVLDKDTLRRGDPAMWMLASVGQAVMGGDAGFAKALQIISKYGPKVTMAGAATIYALARGAVKEAMDKFPGLHVEDPYLEIDLLKTASLFAFSCQMGAVAHFAPPVQEDACREYGKFIGLAYQMADDQVDLLKTIKTGEPHGDLKDRRVTLPLYFLAKESPEVAGLLQGFVAGRVPLGILVQAIKASPKGLERTASQLKILVDQAKASVLRLPDTQFRTILMQIPDFMVSSMQKEVPGE